MNAAKTTNERVSKLRQQRESQGLRRLELWAHPTDHKRIKNYVGRLVRKQTKEAK